MEINYQSVLSVVGSVLAIINALIILENYLKDKPKLEIRTIEDNNSYLWWFKLPETRIDNRKVITYGFLIYIRIVNKGKRRVSLDTWQLEIKPIGCNKRLLSHLPIPKALQELQDGSFIAYPVLGHRNIAGEGNTMIEPGDGISGLCYYAERFFKREDDQEAFNIQENRIKVHFIIKDIFGKRKRRRLIVSYRDFEEINKITPEIDKAMYKKIH